MREEDKARGLLGLCARAGQIAFGEDGCLGAIRTGKCGLLILDQGASANARKRYTDACRYYRVPLATAAAGLVEQSTGKRGRHGRRHCPGAASRINCVPRSGRKFPGKR